MRAALLMALAVCCLSVAAAPLASAGGEVHFICTTLHQSNCDEEYCTSDPQALCRRSDGLDCLLYLSGGCF